MDQQLDLSVRFEVIIFVISGGRDRWAALVHQQLMASHAAI
jgi:hypothetical protein